MQEEKITYRSERVFCGKPKCKRCHEGRGHGPYWYAYRTINGQRKKSYIGLHLPEGVSVAPKALPIGRVNQSPFVGRDAERSLLHTSLMQLERRRSGDERAARLQLLVLTGDAGIGKTRLVEEAARLAKERGWVIAWTTAHAQESGMPYRMWVEVVRKAVVQEPGTLQKATQGSLIYQPLYALLPELQDLLPQDARPASVPPEQEQLRLWDAARALLATISESTPLFIVLDDLQWADSSSCELLGYLVRQLYGQPIMIVGTYRDIELPPNHPLRTVLVDLEREQLAQRLTIQPLSNEQIGDLVGSLPESVVRDIQSLAAGNPFFAEELARFVDAHTKLPGRLESSGAGSPAPTPGAYSSTLPDTISAVLDQHMSKISPPCQRLLTHAAVLGGSFAFNAIRLMEAGGPDANEDTLLDLLDEAMQVGVLTEEGSGTHIIYHFWHPLLVNHLYDSLSASRRASLHRRAAEVLRQLYQDREEEEAATIVYHLERGGTASSQLAHYAEIAGDRAYALSAYPEAERHYRLAVEQRGGTLTADASRASILERLAECTMIQGKFEEARHFYEAVLEGGDQQRSIRSEVENRQEAQRQAILWSEIGWTWRHTGDLAQAHSYCTRGEQLLHTADVTTGPALASLRYLYSSLCWQEGRYDEAYAAALEALSLFEQQQEEVTPTLPRSTRIQRTLEGDPVNQGRIYRLLSALAATVGKNAEALDSLNQALAIFEQYDHQREIAVVSANLGDLYLRMANHSLAEAALHRAISLFERMGDRANMSVCLGNLGILAARCGDLTSAESWYRQGLTLAERVNDPGYVSLWHAYLAATLRDQGRLLEAAGALRRALSTSRATKLTPCIGFSLVTLGSLRIAQASEEVPADVWQHLLGRAKSTLRHALVVEGLEAETGIEAQVMLARVALLQGNLEDAHRLTMHALDEARVSESAWLIARASSLLGSTLVAQGQNAQAERYFSQALQTFRECGMRLEYARTLFSYGVALHRQRDDQQGLNALQEALQIFRECHANFDLQLAEHPLSGREP